jgi:chromosome segregation ATPase
MQEYERAISSKNQELERISMSFRKKGEEYSVLEARCRQFQQEYENIRKKLGEYESRMPQINQEYQIQISQFDMKLKQVMAENE